MSAGPCGLRLTLNFCYPRAGISTRRCLDRYRASNVPERQLRYSRCITMGTCWSNRNGRRMSADVDNSSRSGNDSGMSTNNNISSGSQSAAVAHSAREKAMDTDYVEDVVAKASDFVRDDDEYVDLIKYAQINL